MATPQMSVSSGSKSQLVSEAELLQVQTVCCKPFSILFRQICPFCIHSAYLKDHLTLAVLRRCLCLVVKYVREPRNQRYQGLWVKQNGLHDPVSILSQSKERLC